MKRKVTPVLRVRISHEQRAMFDEIEKVAHIRDSTLTHAFVGALFSYWEKHRSIKLPFTFSDDVSDGVEEEESDERVKTKAKGR